MRSLSRCTCLVRRDVLLTPSHLRLLDFCNGTSIQAPPMAGLDGLIQGVCILRRHKHAQNGILALSGPTCQGRRSLCQWLLACFAFQGIRRPQSQPKPFNANLCVRLSWIVVCFCVLLIALPGCESWRRFGSDRSSFMGESCQTNKFGCKF